MSGPQSAPSEKLRVLFVVDSLYWISATIARQIAERSPWIEPTICSAYVLKSLLKQNGGRYPGTIDLVHFLTYEIAIEFVETFRLEAPCVVTIHHIENDRCLSPAPHCDAVMSVCNQWHDELIARGIPQEKIVLVRNGVRTDIFKPASDAEKLRIRRAFGIPPDAMCVGFTAKRTSDTSGRKGIGTILAAAEALGERMPNAAFAVMGPGWNDVVSSRPGSRWTYFPFLDRKKVTDFYKALDAYWVTSKIEGGPVPLLEAMSSGVACLSTPVGIALEAVDDGVNGFLMPFDSASDFAIRTEWLFENQSKRASIGAAARKTMVADFDARLGAAAVRKLYDVARTNYAARSPNARESANTAGHRFASVRVLRRNAGLSSIPPRLRAHVRAEEHLYFMKFLMQSGATDAAAKVALRAITSNPLDPSVWRRALPAYPRAKTTLTGLYRTFRKVALLERRPSRNIR